MVCLEDNKFTLNLLCKKPVRNHSAEVRFLSTGAVPHSGDSPDLIIYCFNKFILIFQ